MPTVGLRSSEGMSLCGGVERREGRPGARELFTASWSLPLRAYRGKKEFRASLRRDGRINDKNKLFDTPNSAARAALGKPVSGWFFWRYRNAKKEVGAFEESQEVLTDVGSRSGRMQGGLGGCPA